MPTGTDSCGMQPSTQINHPQNITIKAALNGYIVVCGCGTVVFESKKKMLSEISRYLDNPCKVEKEYQSKKRNG